MTALYTIAAFALSYAYREHNTNNLAHRPNLAAWANIMRADMSAKFDSKDGDKENSTIFSDIVSAIAAYKSDYDILQDAGREERVEVKELKETLVQCYAKSVERTDAIVTRYLFWHGCLLLIFKEINPDKEAVVKGAKPPPSHWYDIFTFVSATAKRCMNKPETFRTSLPARLDTDKNIKNAVAFFSGLGNVPEGTSTKKSKVEEAASDNDEEHDEQEQQADPKKHVDKKFRRNNRHQIVKKAKSEQYQRGSPTNNRNSFSPHRRNSNSRSPSWSKGRNFNSRSPSARPPERNSPSPCERCLEKGDLLSKKNAFGHTSDSCLQFDEQGSKKPTWVDRSQRVSKNQGAK